MTERAYFLLTSALLISVGLYTVFYFPKLVDRRVTQGLLTPKQAGLVRPIRLMGLAIILLGLLLLVLDLVVPSR